MGTNSPDDHDAPDAIRPVINRGYLPHWVARHQQFVTFRLQGSLPSCIVNDWRREKIADATPGERQQRWHEMISRVHAYLDLGVGPRTLADPAVAQLVEQAMLHFDQQRHRLRAWVVMPNHVHAVVDVLPPWTIATVVASWKRFSARQINLRLGRTGPLWQREYFDRAIRNDEDLAGTVAYTEGNPVKAGLCRTILDWPFSSAWRRYQAERPGNGPLEELQY